MPAPRRCRRPCAPAASVRRLVIAALLLAAFLHLVLFIVIAAFRLVVCSKRGGAGDGARWVGSGWPSAPAESKQGSRAGTGSRCRHHHRTCTASFAHTARPRPGPCCRPPHPPHLTSPFPATHLTPPPPPTLHHRHLPTRCRCPPPPPPPLRCPPHEASWRRPPRHAAGCVAARSAAGKSGAARSGGRHCALRGGTPCALPQCNPSRASPVGCKPLLGVRVRHAHRLRHSAARCSCVLHFLHAHRGRRVVLAAAAAPRQVHQVLFVCGSKAEGSEGSMIRGEWVFIKQRVGHPSGDAGRRAGERTRMERVLAGAPHGRNAGKRSPACCMRRARTRVHHGSLLGCGSGGAGRRRTCIQSECRLVAACTEPANTRQHGPHMRRQHTDSPASRHRTTSTCGLGLGCRLGFGC